MYAPYVSKFSFFVWDSRYLKMCQFSDTCSYISNDTHKLRRKNIIQSTLVDCQCWISAKMNFRMASITPLHKKYFRPWINISVKAFPQSCSWINIAEFTVQLKKSWHYLKSTRFVIVCFFTEQSGALSMFVELSMKLEKEIPSLDITFWRGSAQNSCLTIFSF